MNKRKSDAIWHEGDNVIFNKVMFNIELLKRSFWNFAFLSQYNFEKIFNLKKKVPQFDMTGAMPFSSKGGLTLIYWKDHFEILYFFRNIIFEKIFNL